MVLSDKDHSACFESGLLIHYASRCAKLGIAGDKTRSPLFDVDHITQYYQVRLMTSNERVGGLPGSICPLSLVALTQSSGINALCIHGSQYVC